MVNLTGKKETRPSGSLPVKSKAVVKAEHRRLSYLWRNLQAQRLLAQPSRKKNLPERPGKQGLASGNILASEISINRYPDRHLRRVFLFYIATKGPQQILAIYIGGRKTYRGKQTTPAEDLKGMIEYAGSLQTRRLGAVHLLAHADLTYIKHTLKFVAAFVKKDLVLAHLDFLDLADKSEKEMLKAVYNRMADLVGTAMLKGMKDHPLRHRNYIPKIHIEIDNTRDKGLV